MSDAPGSGKQAALAGRQTVGAVFLAFLQLGLTSFGGPAALLGYYRKAFVIRRRWLDEQAYADLVGLCQFLPGPASSQVDMCIGLAGALAAWVGFTLPSALAMVLFGYGIVAFGDVIPSGLLHGLKIVAVVAQAVWGMARALCPDPPRATLAVLACVVVTLSPTPLYQLVTIAGGGLGGLAFLRGAAVVGLLLAALYDPVRTRGILSPADFALALIAFALLALWKLPPWLVVLLTGAGGWALAALPALGG